MKNAKLLFLSAVPLLLAGCGPSGPALSSGHMDAGSSSTGGKDDGFAFSYRGRVLYTDFPKEGQFPSYGGELPEGASFNGLEPVFMGFGDSRLFPSSDGAEAEFLYRAENEITSGQDVFVALKDTTGETVGYELSMHNDLESAGTYRIPGSFRNLPVLRIGEAAFMSTCYEKVVVPSGVLSLASYSFNSMENLRSVEFAENNLRSIEPAAFYGDTSLEGTFDLGNIVYLGSDNFALCPNLEGFAAGAYTSFSGEGALLTHRLGEGRTIYKCAEGQKAAVLAIPEGIRAISPVAFSGVKAEKVVFPLGLLELGKACFEGSLVREVDMSASSLAVLPDRAFRQSTAMEKISFPAGLETIGESCFAYTALREVELPDGVVSIKPLSFAYLKQLERFAIGSSLSEIGPGALDDQPLASYEVDESNTSFRAENGCIYSADLSTLYRVPESALRYTRLSETRTIASGAFYQCSLLQSADLEGVESVGSYAFFMATSLVSLDVSGAKELGEYAFYGTEGLESISLPALETLPGSLLYGAVNLGELTVPEGVKEISSECFSYCTSLTTLDLPGSLAVLGTNCLAPTGLTLIRFHGSEEQWNAIEGLSSSGLDDLTEVAFLG